MRQNTAPAFEPARRTSTAARFAGLALGALLVAVAIGAPASAGHAAPASETTHEANRHATDTRAHADVARRSVDGVASNATDDQAAALGHVQRLGSHASNAALAAANGAPEDQRKAVRAMGLDAVAGIEDAGGAAGSPAAGLAARVAAACARASDALVNGSSALWNGTEATYNAVVSMVVSVAQRPPSDANDGIVLGFETINLGLAAVAGFASSVIDVANDLVAAAGEVLA